jgi:hypothetical protein
MKLIIERVNSKLSKKLCFISLLILIVNSCTKINQISPYDYQGEILNYILVDEHVKDMPHYLTANVLNNPTDENLRDVVDYLIEDANDIESKARRIHDWIVINILYDIGRYNDGNYRSYFYSEVLRTRLTMCGGFTDLFFVMCRMASLRVSSVTGDSANAHIWNAVWNGTEWLHVDATWDAGRFENGVLSPSYSETYFFMTEAEISTKPSHAMDGGVFHYDESKAPYSDYE